MIKNVAFHYYFCQWTWRGIMIITVSVLRIWTEVRGRIDPWTKEKVVTPKFRDWSRSCIVDPVIRIWIVFFTLSKLRDWALFDIIRRWRRFELYECFAVQVRVNQVEVGNTSFKRSNVSSWNQPSLVALLGARDKNSALNWKMSLWGPNQACSQTTPIAAAKIVGAIVTSRPEHNLLN